MQFKEETAPSVFQPYIVKFMCNKSAFEGQQTSSKAIENQLVDY